MMGDGMDGEKFGLSKKTNVAIAAITGITISVSAQLWQSISATAAILIIGLYHIHKQSEIDLKGKSNV